MTTSALCALMSEKKSTFSKLVAGFMMISEASSDHFGVHPKIGETPDCKVNTLYGERFCWKARCSLYKGFTVQVAKPVRAAFDAAAYNLLLLCVVLCY